MAGKSLQLWALVVAGLALGLTGVIFYLKSSEPLPVVKNDEEVSFPMATSSKIDIPTAGTAAANRSEEPAVKIGELIIPVEVRRTPEELQKGLSGRPNLAADLGMFFIFKTAARHSFWMPDMNFPIDIIWIENGAIADITENVSNEFDPENPKFYRPAVPVRYVLEVNAGFAVAHKLKVGQAVTFHNLN